MVRYFDKIGYEPEGTLVDGVYTADIIERDHYGEVLRATRNLIQADKVNDDISLSNRVSIVADAFALENFAFIKYAMWNGARWTVTSVDVEPPRLILNLGGVYNGKIPTP